MIGCRDNRDRIELARDLKEFVLAEQTSQGESDRKNLSICKDYSLAMSSDLRSFIERSDAAKIATSMPKYDFISPSLALIIMQEVRKMLMDKDLLEIFGEKESETRLPFDALRDLCSRFERNFNDEHCTFVTASYLTAIDEGVIYINFKEFLADLRDSKGKDLDVLSSARLKQTTSIGSDNSDSDARRSLRSSPLQDMLGRGQASKTGALGRSRRTADEEHMLDIAESIFVRMAQLMTE